MILTTIIERIPALKKPARKFLSTLLFTILHLPVRCTYSNLSRYSDSSERRFRRWSKKPFDYAELHHAILSQLPQAKYSVAAMDCVFIPKSGKQTYGLGRFWNGCNKRLEPGLEVCCIGLVHKQFNTCFVLSAVQTDPIINKGDSMRQHIAQLRACAPEILKHTRLLTVDGAFARKELINAAAALKLTVITKLRKDANLRHLYYGKQKRNSGRRKKYDGKVRFNDLSKMNRVDEKIDFLPHRCKAYTAIVNSPNLKMDLRIVVVSDGENYMVYCSTNTSMSAKEILIAYNQRFQIELVFRDAKQHTGFTQCQARSKEALNHHFNASLAAVGIAKADMVTGSGRAKKQPLSLQDYKTQRLNEHLLWRILCNFDIDPELILSHPNYDSFIREGCIAA